MQGSLVCCMFVVLWNCSSPFQLHDVLRDLQAENALLHHKVENMTEMLMELKFYIWNNSRGSVSTPEHLQGNVFCKQDYIRAGSSRTNCPVPLLIAAAQALLSILSK
ncbi:hypothetical protein FKM82_013472 [Ascaphus truei]